MAVYLLVILIMVICVVGIVGIMGFIFFVVRKKEKKKSKALRRFASQNGFQFYDDNGRGMININRMAKFPIFNIGYMKSVKNILIGGRRYNWTIFDYHYTTGHSGPHTSATHHQFTVFRVRLDRNIADFVLTKENFITKVADAFGANDIDFQTHPRFSNTYRLRSKDPSIRSTFNKQALDFFERSNFNFCIQSVGNEVIFYNHSVRASPSNIFPYLDQFETLLDLFTGRVDQNVRTDQNVSNGRMESRNRR